MNSGKGDKGDMGLMGDKGNKDDKGDKDGKGGKGDTEMINGYDWLHTHHPYNARFLPHSPYPTVIVLRPPPGSNVLSGTVSFDCTKSNLSILQFFILWSNQHHFWRYVMLSGASADINACGSPSADINACYLGPCPRARVPGSGSPDPARPPSSWGPFT